MVYTGGLLELYQQEENIFGKKLNYYLSPILLKKVEVEVEKVVEKIVEKPVIQEKIIEKEIEVPKQIEKKVFCSRSSTHG